MPNGPLATGSLINYSAQLTRRVDWTFGIAYGDDVDSAYAVIRKLIAQNEQILGDPKPFMAGAFPDERRSLQSICQSRIDHPVPAT